MKNNLFNNPKVYVVQSTEQEAYETQFTFLLKVKDAGNAMEKTVEEEDYDNTDQLMKALYNDFLNFRLGKSISKKFDPKKYEVQISINEQKSARIAVVKIYRRRVQEKLKEGLKILAKKFIGAENSLDE